MDLGQRTVLIAVDDARGMTWLPRVGCVSPWQRAESYLFDRFFCCGNFLFGVCLRSPAAQRSRAFWQEGFPHTRKAKTMAKTQTNTNGARQANPLNATTDLEAMIAALRAENEALKARRQGTMTFKVSEKGAVSVYGMGRFPVTLYGEQWVRLLGVADDLRDFIKANAAQLKTKG